MQRFSSLVLTIAVAVMPNAAVAQALTADETTKIDKIVNDNLSRTGVPSASIAIVRGGQIILTKAYGKQSEAIPVARSEAPYQIASVSKQFTAAALLLLQRDGKLNLDDKVAKYLPGISGGDRIALRQLLSHTSGLQDYWPQDYSFAAMAQPTTAQGIVDRWAKKPLDYEPGTQWQYSNTGYVVAGMIVEKVAGTSLLEFLQARVFRPLGMRVMNQDLAVGPAYPQGYQRFALGPVRVEKPAASGWLFAAGELAMSAGDLAKWNIARMERKLLLASEWEAQETPVKLADGSGTGYGLGVSTGKRGERRFIEHAGEAVGFLSESIVFPDERASIIVLVNSDFSDAYTVIARDVATVVLPPLAADQSEILQTKQARAIFDALRGGTIDRRLLTENANYYFTPTALEDYRSSLSKLGEPKSFELVRKPRLRGGFVNRNYRISYEARSLNVITYSEPGENARFEQFLVMPAE